MLQIVFAAIVLEFCAEQLQQRPRPCTGKEESTGNARRDSTDLNVPKTFQVKK